MRLINLLKGVEFSSNLNLNKIENIKIKDISYNSKDTKEGFVFVALLGETIDGHKYIKDAYNRGARVFIISENIKLPKNSVKILVENTRKTLSKISSNFFCNPSKELKVIGITGTKGKTTTSNYIADIFENAGYSTGIIGTNGVFYDDIKEDTQNTTPESYEIQRILRKMIDKEVTFVILEVSSGGLKMNRVNDIKFDIGIFTNISRDHIGPKEHPDFKDYLNSKAILFKLCKHAIINIDDKHAKDIIKDTNCTVNRFSIEKESDYRAINIKFSNNIKTLGSSFTCKTKNGEYSYELASPGIFNVYNALSSIAVSEYFKISKPMIRKILKNVTVNGRAELLSILDYASVVLDYAHNEVSLQTIINTLKIYNPNRLICLIGSVGNRSELRRKELGDIAAKECDISIITSDNPDFEDPQKIVDEIAASFKDSNCKLIKEVDREKAIKIGINLLQENDILLLAGKGHEKHQLIEGEKVYFNDRETAIDAAKELLGNKTRID